MTTNLDWQADGLCREIGGDLMYPEQWESARAAKSACMACAVRIECLDYALATSQEWGVWGGMTPTQRRALKRQAVAA